jgi:hypothetical protein
MCVTEKRAKLKIGPKNDRTLIGNLFLFSLRMMLLMCERYGFAIGIAKSHRKLSF